MANPLAITLHASGAELASGSGPAVDITATTSTTSHPRSCAKLTLDVSALVGTGTFEAMLQTSANQTSWKDIGLFQRSAEAPSQFTDKTRTVDLVFTSCLRYVRVRWVLTGFTSATFSVDGFAHTLYCEPKDLTKTAVNERALDEVGLDVLAECCLRATSDCETALSSSNTMPISDWGEDLRGHVAARAVFYVINNRGVDPGGPDGMLVLAGGYRTPEGVKSAAQGFFDDVASGKIKPVKIVDATPDEYEGSGVVVSGPSRFGWC